MKQEDCGERDKYGINWIKTVWGTLNIHVQENLMVQRNRWFPLELSYLWAFDFHRINNEVLSQSMQLILGEISIYVKFNEFWRILLRLAKLLYLKEFKLPSPYPQCILFDKYNPFFYKQLEMTFYNETRQFLYLQYVVDIMSIKNDIRIPYMNIEYMNQIQLNALGYIKYISNCIYIGLLSFINYQKFLRKLFILTQVHLPSTIAYQTPLVLVFTIEMNPEFTNHENESNSSHQSTGLANSHPNGISNGYKNKYKDTILTNTSTSSQESTREIDKMPLRKAKSKSKSITPGFSADDNFTSQSSFSTTSSSGQNLKSNFLPHNSGSQVFKNKQKKHTNFYHAPTTVKRHTSSQKLCELQAEFLESVQYSTSVDSTLSSRYGSLDTCSIAMDNASNTSKRKLQNNPWNTKES